MITTTTAVLTVPPPRASLALLDIIGWIGGVKLLTPPSGTEKVGDQEVRNTQRRGVLHSLNLSKVSFRRQIAVNAQYE